MIVKNILNIVQKILFSSYTNSSPANGELWFDGTDMYVRVNGVSRKLGTLGAQAAAKTADESVASSTTFQDDDHIKFWVGANESWAFNLVMRGTANASGGIKLRFTVPSGATCNGLAQITSYLTSTNVDWTTGTSTLATLATTNLGGIFGYVVNGSTAGWVQLQFAQNTSFGTNTTIMKGTIIHAIQIS